MHHVEITCRATAQEVFDVLTDWSRQHEWMPFTRARGGQGVGAAIEGWTGVGRVGFLDTMVITEWTPGRRVVAHHTGRVIRGDGWFETNPRLQGWANTGPSWSGRTSGSTGPVRTPRSPIRSGSAARSVKPRNGTA